jgi:hypothetical protein
MSGVDVGTNRLPDPVRADRVSGTGKGPCADADRLAGAAGNPPISASAPAGLSLVAVHRGLADLTAEIGPLARFLSDMTWRQQPDPIGLCHWLDDLKSRVERVQSVALLLIHVCDVTWEQSCEESMRRRAQA